ncbi:MAG: type IV pilin protein [Clostridium fessum]
MKGLIKKVRENKKGFTLAELLVVVAIVGILVAISIPVFTAQLSKARKATNQSEYESSKRRQRLLVSDRQCRFSFKN